MASKVMVKMPVAPFAQVNKSKNGNVSSEIVLSRSPELPVAKNGTQEQTQKTPEQVRITQLEHNVKFLQEQHQLMLNGLHTEVESLKTRNRELQFQLVFARGPIPANSPSTPSSPEDDTKHKLYTSPKPPNCTPLQVELLEKELGEIKLQMTEIENRNAYLSAIVDEQKKKLERYERDREKEQQQWVNQVDEAELLRKLDDAEMLIRRLRRENSDLRREAAQQTVSAVQQAHGHQGQGNAQAQYHGTPGGQPHFNKDNNGYQPRPQGSRGGSGRHRTGNNGSPGNGGYHSGNNGHTGQHNGQQHYNNRGGWFPPLHSQSFWQGGRQQNDRQMPPHHQTEPTNLPTLQHQMSEPSGSHQYRDQYHNNHGKRGSNNNHYRNNGDGGRTYRSGGHKNGGKPS